MPFKALIFDMDGTIVDNMPYHNKGWELWFGSRGLPFDEAGFFARTAGRTNREILREVFPEQTTPRSTRWARRRRPSTARPTRRMSRR